ncbi:recombination-associated protein RdgC [Marinobacterium jannaschii]|uniref:recombination-associated protein RdgC n=1 Tax=Marinobacterium jannaschii TaxID=64970 RepID=UPI0004861D48|nr:recombination-associated protein RdgC [Marinobacterium jannaschii]
MWFKNFIFYRFTGPFEFNETQLEEALQEHTYSPCGSQELSRYGWVTPAKELQDTLCHSVHGFHVVAAQKEEKILPPAVVKQIVDEKVELIEDEQARKVYRKERDQIKDEVIIDLLPRAFSRFQRTMALIAPQQGWIIVDASSHKRAEELLTHLRGSVGSLPVALPEVKQSPSAVMTSWLESGQGMPNGLTILDECELRDNLVESGVIRIKGQDLTDDEFTAHLEAGKRVVKLAVEWEEQLRFVLQEDLAIKRLKMTEQMQEKRDQDSQEDQLAQFDADIAMIGLELTRLIPVILEAFGGLTDE